MPFISPLSTVDSSLFGSKFEIRPMPETPARASAVYGFRLTIFNSAGIANRIKLITPFTRTPRGVKNNAATPSNDGHQSFKNLPIASIFF